MSTTSPPTRLVRGVRVPAVGIWVIDPAHAYVGFVGRRLSSSRVRGRFLSVAGALRITEDPWQSRIEATVAMGSVCSGASARDERLRSVEHFDVARHPTASFRSTQILWTSRSARVTGELTMVGVTNPVELCVRYRGTVVDRRSVDRAVFSAVGALDRGDWGLTWNVMLDRGVPLIGRAIRVEIDVEVVRQPVPGR